MKKLICVLLVFVLASSLCGAALAADGGLTISIDGRQVVFSDDYGYPYIDENDRTLVPLRVVMEQFGCAVVWNEAERTAVISKDGTTVLVPIGEKHIVVNGATVAIDTEAVINGGRTYLPIRAVLEAFGAKVEWKNGSVIVTTPSASGIENIYIDSKGNLIFERANGNKVTVGSVSSGQDGKDGKDGKDGVSVKDASVDAAGNLIITLSNGKTINAGNVTAGGDLSFLTFEDYPIGTKFYLTKPTGEFDVPFEYDGASYTVHFSDVHYELTAKRDFNDAEAWVFEEYDHGTNAHYEPYAVRVYIEGSTSSDLEGCTIEVQFYEVQSGGWYYRGTVDAEGHFLIDTKQINIWYAPKELVFYQLSMWNYT